MLTRYVQSLHVNYIFSNTLISYDLQIYSFSSIKKKKKEKNLMKLRL